MPEQNALRHAESGAYPPCVTGVRICTKRSENATSTPEKPPTCVICLALSRAQVRFLPDTRPGNVITCERRTRRVALSHCM